METRKSSDIITAALFDNLKVFWKSPRSVLVHTSIINKVENALHKTFTNTDWAMYEHKLKIGSDHYEMHLINVLRSNEVQEDFVHALVIDSQFSFPWEENPTLFIAAEDFHNMKEFIKRYNLEAFILKVEEKLGYFIGGDHPIKVVSFNQSVSAKLDIVDKFKNWRKNKKNHYLFMTKGLQWQQFNLLRRIRLNDNIYSVLPIILRHLGTLNYANDLNIMDLLSLRLAISDVRDSSNSNLLIYEIDFMIKRILAKLIKNNHLSIKQYLIAKNIVPLELLMVYLIYEFQHLFQTLDLYGIVNRNPQKPQLLHASFKLNEEIDVVNKLKESFNINFTIDGRGFDKMSLSLFVNLMELQNVSNIVLDTNYRWCNDVFTSKHNRIIPRCKEGRVNIYFIGKNTYNFVEGLTVELQSHCETITLVNNRILLHIHCNLNDYRIFDNLKVDIIIFNDIKVDLNMLQNLQQCDTEPSISLTNCFLESTSRNWQILNNLEKLNEVTINENEGTWLSMFEFILEEIHLSNTNQFQFNSKDSFEIWEPLVNSINLNSIKFAVDEQKSKLEIRRQDTNEVVDLYCRKYGIQQEEKSNYEFYQ